MNKLTAKKCLERIDKLKTFQRRFGISIFEEEYLEALEIALPILEQQDGWISCSDRMPTNGKAVIVCSHQGTVQDMNYFWAYGKWWPVTEDEDSAPEGEFSHWQPIPAPPQQPTTDTYRQIDNDGWVEWGGGKRPVDSDCVVGIRYRDGEEDAGVAGYQSWRHYGEEDDIIAYRIIPERAANQNGEQ